MYIIGVINYISLTKIITIVNEPLKRDFSVASNIVLQTKLIPITTCLANVPVVVTHWDNYSNIISAVPWDTYCVFVKCSGSFVLSTHTIQLKGLVNNKCISDYTFSIIIVWRVVVNILNSQISKIIFKN